jgi:hypothetical protein
MSVQFGDSFVSRGEHHEWTTRFERVTNVELLSLKAEIIVSGVAEGIIVDEIVF